MGLSLAAERNKKEKKEKIELKLDQIESKINNTSPQIKRDQYSTRIIDEYNIRKFKYGVISCTNNGFDFEVINIESKNKEEMTTRTLDNNNQLQSANANYLIEPGIFKPVSSVKKFSRSELFNYLRTL